MLDVTKQRADRLRRRPDFPAPVGSWARGDLWSERDVRRWARTYEGDLTVWGTPVGQTTQGERSSDKIARRARSPSEASLRGMSGSLPLARLSKDERWAVCAQVECGERFAKRTTSAVARQPSKAELEFLPGWVLHGDTWAMSGRARRRLSEGRQPAFRRVPPFDPGGWRDSWDPLKNEPLRWRDRADSTPRCASAFLVSARTSPSALGRVAVRRTPYRRRDERR
jgi:hypothetical protein